jgi:hypothetical protein
MSDSPIPRTRKHDSYEEFARKMQLFEDGPTTTNFQRLVDRGIELPPPDDLVIAEFFAGDEFRKQIAMDYPGEPLSAHEDPPYQRDQLLPGPDYEGGPEALAWLRANHHPNPFATNRFGSARTGCAVRRTVVRSRSDVRVNRRHAHASEPQLGAICRYADCRSTRRPRETP